VTAISETRDLTTLTNVSLFGKLRKHELEMTRLKEMETVGRKTRSLALKTNVAGVDYNEESPDEYSDTENLNLLTRRFWKFITMKLKCRTSKARGIIRNLILVLLNSPILVVVNKDTLKWIVQAL